MIHTIDCAADCYEKGTSIQWSEQQRTELDSTCFHSCCIPLTCYPTNIMKSSFEKQKSTYRGWVQRRQRHRKSQESTNESTARLNLAQPSWRSAFLLHSLSRLFCCKMLPKQMRQVAPLVLLRKGRFVSHILDFEEVLCSIII